MSDEGGAVDVGAEAPEESAPQVQEHDGEGRKLKKIAAPKGLDGEGIDDDLLLPDDSVEDDEPEEKKSAELAEWQERTRRAEGKIERMRKESKAQLQALREEHSQKWESVLPIINAWREHQSAQEEAQLPSFDDDPDAALAARVEREAARLREKEREEYQQQQQQAEQQLHDGVVGACREAAQVNPDGWKAVVALWAHAFEAHVDNHGAEPEDFPRYMVEWMKGQARQGVHPIKAAMDYAQQVQQWMQSQQAGRQNGNGHPAPPKAPAGKPRPREDVFATPSSSSRPAGKPLTVEDITSMDIDDFVRLRNKGAITDEMARDSWATAD